MSALSNLWFPCAQTIPFSYSANVILHPDNIPYGTLLQLQGVVSLVTCLTSPLFAYLLGGTRIRGCLHLIDRVK